jgi:hypothetical protein
MASHGLMKANYPERFSIGLIDAFRFTRLRFG